VVGDICFAFDNPAIWRFSTPNVYLPFNVFGIWTDKHFEFHVRAPSPPLIRISEPAGPPSSRDRHRFLTSQSWKRNVPSLMSLVECPISAPVNRVALTVRS
jgi:hypothetical protein